MLIPAWWDMWHSHLLDWNPSAVRTHWPGSLRPPRVTRWGPGRQQKGLITLRASMGKWPLASGTYLFSPPFWEQIMGGWTQEGVSIIWYPSWSKSERFQFPNDIIFSLCIAQRNPNYTKPQLCPQKLIHLPTAISRLFLKEAFTSAGY